jgi:hypothetical protein
MEQREALRRSAKALKKTESELIRDLLARNLDGRTLGERAGHLAGSIDNFGFVEHRQRARWSVRFGSRKQKENESSSCRANSEHSSNPKSSRASR